jgi:hypothetical protein
VSFESGTGRVLHLGAPALDGRDALLGAIEEGLSVTEPTVEKSLNEDLLTKAEESAATKQTGAALRDPRSVRIVQGLVGTEPDGIVGRETVERVASLQAEEGREPTGRLDVKTMELIHKRLRTTGELNAAIRLMIDFFRVDDGSILETSVDDDTSFAAAGGIGAAITIAPTEGQSVSVIRFRSSAIDTDFANALATVIHEFEHARQNLLGLEWSGPRLEFYGHSEPMLRAGTPQVGLFQFLPETSRLLGLWADMRPEEQVEAWPRFERLRQVVLDRSADFLSAPDIEEGPRELLEERIQQFNDVPMP